MGIVRETVTSACLIRKIKLCPAPFLEALPGQAASGEDAVAAGCRYRLLCRLLCERSESNRNHVVMK